MLSKFKSKLTSVRQLPQEEIVATINEEEDESVVTTDWYDLIRVTLNINIAYMYNYL